MKVLIVGGVAGGATAAARLRRLDESAEIILFERGEHISFANCGLPYYIGGEIEDKSALLLQTPQGFRMRYGVDVRVRQEVRAIRPETKEILVRKVETGEEYTESYDTLLLSPGAFPIMPQIEGADDECVFTLRNIPDTYRIREYIEARRPKTAVVIGGGFIGLEMAENLAGAGLSVALAEKAEHVLPNLDFEMACEAHACLRANGVKLFLNSGVCAIRRENGALSVELEKGERLAADMVVLAIGVRPDTALAAEAGIALGVRGTIITDEAMRTNIPGIYAVGDAVQIRNSVTGQPAWIPLAGPANRQARVAADNICGVPSLYEGAQGSAILKLFGMTIASTGLTEREARLAGIDCDKAYTFSASHAGYYPGGSMMSVKTLYEKGTGRVLGAQIAGRDGVDKRCDVLAVAVRMGMNARDLTRLELCYAPPYSSAKDPVNMAGYVIENVMARMYGQFHWDEVDALPRDGSVTLLDVRTPWEVSSGRIEGFRNIPLDGLRARIGELEPGKPVYIHCHSGMRSYLACRILAGRGFECYNLGGGFRLYDLIRQERHFRDR